MPKVPKYDTLESRLFAGWAVKHRGQPLSDEIVEELQRIWSLVEDFDVKKVAPTTYLLKKVKEIYLPSVVCIILVNLSKFDCF